MHKPVIIGYRTLELSTHQKLSISFAQPRPEIPSLRLLTKCLLIVLSLVVATPRASATDPLGATLHSDGTTTFRVWAPFVDNVAVKIDGSTVPQAQEPGHTDPA
jgi:hypothetical protein